MRYITTIIVLLTAVSMVQAAENGIVSKVAYVEADTKRCVAVEEDGVLMICAGHVKEPITKVLVPLGTTLKDVVISRVKKLPRTRS